MRPWSGSTKSHFRDTALSLYSGYDFGYMLKILCNENLPSEESEFFEMLRLYFPNIYDVKYLMKSCKNLKGGLQEVAEQLEVRMVLLHGCHFVDIELIGA